MEGEPGPPRSREMARAARRGLQAPPAKAGALGSSRCCHFSPSAGRAARLGSRGRGGERGLPPLGCTRHHPGLPQPGGLEC